MRSLGAEPGDTARYARAVDRAIERHAHTLSAERPGWLTGLLGDRPADVAGATTWDDAVHQIAHWRARHQLPDHTEGLGPRPTDPDLAAGWDALQARLGLTRTWLAGTDRIHPADTIIPSRTELLERRAELDGLLAGAPADWRTTISQLRSGQLSLDDTADLLQAALDGQAARRDWIIANWPHVVEYQEINRTLTTATWGPDPGLLTDLLTRAVSDPLADVDRARRAVAAGRPHPHRRRRHHPPRRPGRQLPRRPRRLPGRSRHRPLGAARPVLVVPRPPRCSHRRARLGR